MSVSLSDIRAAAARLSSAAIMTPLIESPALNERVDGRVLIKPECLQRMGAFKFRGAFNRLSLLSPAQKAAGVVAFSSGNHAQGVALAARLLGISALIVMPADAPAVKIEGSRLEGAEIRFYDRERNNREGLAAQIAAERGWVIVPAYDDVDIIAGQGTVGLEIVEQAAEARAEVDLVIGPIGGGGLMAGVSTAIKSLRPAAAIWGVEPEGYDDTRLSLEAGERRRAPPFRRSLCDALEAPIPGELTFPLLAPNLAGVAAVSDEEVAGAMRYAFRSLKLVVEPGGAVALAALLEGKIKPPAEATVIILSGGNVDPALFARVIGGET